MKKVHKAIANILGVVGLFLVLGAAGDNTLGFSTEKQLIIQSSIGIVCAVIAYKMEAKEQ